MSGARSTRVRDQPAGQGTSENRRGGTDEESGPRVFERGSDGLEFDRVAFFSDAVFAIAMTLLVVGIGVPRVAGAELGDALRELSHEILSFFITFTVLGFYWAGHHRFYARLARVEHGLVALNFVYLAAIAFMPFPTALVGSYENEPVTVAIYAITLAAASLLEAAMYVRAARAGLFRVQPSAPAFRFSVVAQTVPVAIFLVSVPIALVDPTLALLSWLLIFPAGYLIHRWYRPPGQTSPTYQ